MSRQAHRELSFEVPDDWEDKSISAFAPHHQEGKLGTSVTITREPNAGSRSLRAHVAQQLATVSRALADFDLRETRDATVGGLPAVISDFSFSGETGAIAQRYVLVQFKQWIYSITYTMPKGDIEKSLPAFERVLASVAFPS